MGVHPPYLFDAEPGSVAVRSEFDAEITVVAVRDRWGRGLWHRVTTTLNKCFSQHPRGLLLDLSGLDDASGHSVPTWLNAYRRGEHMDPGVPVALCAPDGGVLAGRLRRTGDGLPVYPRADSAREALAGRLPQPRRLFMRITPESLAARRARRLVQDACEAWELPDLEFPAQLVVSELVSNVVEHTGSEGRLLVARRGDGLHIAVADRSPHLPRPRERNGPDLKEGGRGLQIVHRLSAVWGAMPIDDGKVVWATVQDPMPG
ncbi:ATP-binding protein [Actinoplanes sp. NPDC051861]|uniref:ATP-binding protein n=1 Tax=Actinoplanes sp. NPDC051861 TaxID=3155170 RepID=UPI003441121A